MNGIETIMTSVQNRTCLLSSVNTRRLYIVGNAAQVKIRTVEGNVKLTRSLYQVGAVRQSQYAFVAAGMRLTIACVSGQGPNYLTLAK